MHSERIDKFLKDQMSAEENNAFLHDLECDKDLREQAQITALMIKELQERQAKDDSEIIEEVLKAKKKARIVQMTKWSLSIAALFILIYGASTFWKRQSNTDALFTQYYTSYDASLARGGDDETIKEELALLYNKVGTDNDLAPAISRLQIIYDNILSNNDAYLDYKRYKNDIAWYLALAYLKDHNIEKTKELLKPLVDNEGDEAIKLMAEIEEMQL